MSDGRFLSLDDADESRIVRHIHNPALDYIELRGELVIMGRIFPIIYKQYANGQMTIRRDESAPDKAGQEKR